MSDAPPVESPAPVEPEIPQAAPPEDTKPAPTESSVPEPSVESPPPEPAPSAPDDSTPSDPTHSWTTRSFGFMHEGQLLQGTSYRDGANLNAAGLFGGVYYDSLNDLMRGIAPERQDAVLATIQRLVR